MLGKHGGFALFIEFEDIKTYVAIAAFIISIFALFNGRNSRKLAEESLAISKQVKREAEIEYLKTIPAIDIIEVIKVDNTYRVVLLLSNMRTTPFRINCVGLSKKVYKKRNIKNYIRSRTDSDFNWNYEQINNFDWNPQGDLDTEEKYTKEAAKFLVVKDLERVLVSIPDFNQYSTYQFKVNTTHGVVTLADSISPNGKVHFCKEFRQSFT
ncbi:hypothetical protein L4D13_18420 [Photobacterium profundum]|uniref:hypothetical protein n=1 Tax=Photobacterium profundum TaxID=74109 RepID=UPI003D137FAC